MSDPDKDVSRVSTAQRVETVILEVLTNALSAGSSTMGETHD